MCTDNSITFNLICFLFSLRQRLADALLLDSVLGETDCRCATVNCNKRIRIFICFSVVGRLGEVLMCVELKMIALGKKLHWHESAGSCEKKRRKKNAYCEAEVPRMKYQLPDLLPVLVFCCNDLFSCF